MQNEEGTVVDLYIPRKCSATNRLITANDHASVQINVGHLDDKGIYNGHFSTYALSGFIRALATRVSFPLTPDFIVFGGINLDEARSEPLEWPAW